MMFLKPLSPTHRPHTFDRQPGVTSSTRVAILIAANFGSGKGVWAMAQRYWDGSVTNTPLSITKLNNNQYAVRFQTLRGFHCNLQTTPECTQTFANEPPKVSQPFDALTISQTNSFAEPAKFFSVSTKLVP